MQKTSRASGFQHKYGIAGAGAVRSCLIGQLPGKTFGPVSGVSYRVASRIANTLPGGYAARTPDELNQVPAILFHSSQEQMQPLIKLLENARIDWPGKSLIFCDCVVDRPTVGYFLDKGASVALARQFEIPGFLVIEGTGPALNIANRLATQLRLKAIEIVEGTAQAFGAAVTLGTCALTPLLDRVAALLREAGVRDTDAPRLAAALFQRTGAEYAHSGKQSWGWYLRQPEAEEIDAQIASAGDQLGPVMRQLLLYGFELYGKHAETAEALKPKNEQKPGLTRPG